MKSFKIKQILENVCIYDLFDGHNHWNYCIDIYKMRTKSRKIIYVLRKIDDENKIYKYYLIDKKYYNQLKEKEGEFEFDEFDNLDKSYKEVVFL